jgi:8-oxo-dGTP diphosphatase
MRARIAKLASSPNVADIAMAPQPKHFVHWPRVGASICVFRGTDVLLVERGKGALQGYWSLPGGHIEPGETARNAALRELAEETGVTAELIGLVDVHDVLIKTASGELTAHYVLTVFFGRWVAGQPVAGGDARSTRFVPLSDLKQYEMTDGAARIIGQAWHLLQTRLSESD